LPNPNLPDPKALLAAWENVLDAIPKAKRRPLFPDMAAVEDVLRRGLVALPLLDALRNYFLDPAHGGEQSPFVVRIDRLIPRAAPPADCSPAKEDKPDEPHP